ncbi:MAG: hypothetical protein OXG59_15205 [Gammaproteobacteria bacterium]|nr:hypothetical protein [Gammaproteobacteria bacterium]
MTEDAGTGLIEIGRANRRGFLVGITLAELMLMILFVLLLLNRNFQLDAMETAEVKEEFGGVEPLSEARSMAQQLVEVQSETELSETWRTLTRTVKELSSEPERLERWLEDLEDNPMPEIAQKTDREEAMREEIHSLRSELVDAETAKERAENRSRQLQEELQTQQSEREKEASRREALSAELAQAKAGELVICTYEPPGPGSVSSLRGRSVPLGTVHLEDDGITLIEKSTELSNTRLVDYVGDYYDATEAAELLESWPLYRKLGFDELSSIGNRFIEIGDRAAEKRARCRFSMNYYIEDFITPHSVMLTFERYFFQQSRISDSRYEELMESTSDRQHDPQH